MPIFSKTGTAKPTTLALGEALGGGRSTNRAEGLPWLAVAALPGHRERAEGYVISMTSSLSTGSARRVLSGTVVAAATAAALALSSPAAHAASGCTTLSDGHSGSSRVCKSWTAVGGGYYRGTWSIGVTTSYTYVQVYKDGAVSTVGGGGSYSHLKKFYMRACSDFGGCGGWW